MRGQAPKKNRRSELLTAPAIGDSSANPSATECRTSLYYEGDRHPERIDADDARADGAIQAPDLVGDERLHFREAVLGWKRSPEKTQSSIASGPAPRQTPQ